MPFKISKSISPNKAFLTMWSHLEGRLDPNFYQPALEAVEFAVQKRTDKKLGDFAVSMSSGATPKKAQADEFYSNESEGVPLLRVQNVTEEGINSDNLVFINQHTHENYLARSQVRSGDLLITITGRIASCAVAPKNFEGNINQHSVVVKTQNKKTSEYLAAFINSNVGYQLAIKRVTGGTRPALDYETLKSIPIIEGLPIVEVMRAAYANKKQKVNEAEMLLGSIDGYLRGELGMKQASDGDKSLQSRVFLRQLSEITTGRFDPFFHSLSKQPQTGKYPFFNLACKASIKKGQSFTSDDCIEGNIPVIAGGKIPPYFHNVANCEGDVVTVSASGTAGYVWYHESPIFASDCIIVSSKDKKVLNNQFLFEYLKSEQQSLYNLQHGSIQPHVYPVDLERIKIPVPPLAKQLEVVKHISTIRNKAKQLQQQAQESLAKAKRQVEAIILGNAKS